ncbi:conserved protein of unknown function [Burkholderia multivorans]
MVVTGGFRFGMMIARPNWRAVCGSTPASIAPSRTCRCQSSGRASVSVVRGEAFEAVIGGVVRSAGQSEAPDGAGDGPGGAGAAPTDGKPQHGTVGRRIPLFAALGSVIC